MPLLSRPTSETLETGDGESFFFFFQCFECNFENFPNDGIMRVCGWFFKVGFEILATFSHYTSLTVLRGTCVCVCLPVHGGQTGSNGQRQVTVMPQPRRFGDEVLADPAAAAAQRQQESHQVAVD